MHFQKFFSNHPNVQKLIGFSGEKIRNYLIFQLAETDLNSFLEDYPELAKNNKIQR